MHHEPFLLLVTRSGDHVACTRHDIDQDRAERYLAELAVSPGIVIPGSTPCPTIPGRRHWQLATPDDEEGIARP